MHRLAALAVLGFAVAAQAESGLARAVDGYLAALVDEESAPIVVTATRSAQPAFDAPVAIDTVSEKTLRRRSYRTTPQVLRDIPGAMVQETAAGQGSPFIRGFTGFRNLFLIDGIRLNNSVFRSGPNQYWNTVDPFSLERFEVVKGPSSVLYGSDAVGGTINAITRVPYGSGGRVVYRGATAEHSHVGRTELSVALSEATALLMGLSAKTYGELVAGGDIGTQRNVGYDEWDGDVKIEHFLDDDTRLVAAYQHVQQNNVPRTHRTTAAKSFHGTTVGNELRRDLDQERYLVYAQIHKENMAGFLEVFRASVSWHDQTESRDRLRTGGRRDIQGFNAGTLGIWFQFESPSPWGRFTYGVEFYHDNVNSFSSRNPIQGPVGDDATYDLFGLYVQDVIDVTKRLVLTLGARLNHAAADADSVQDPTTGERTSVSDDWTSVVGSFRFLFKWIPEKLNLFGGVSQGFRAPNLTDLTRFDSQRSNEFEIPALDLEPEFYTMFEIGLKGRTGRAGFEIAAFFTDIRDQIKVFPTGNTNESGEFEVTKDNIGDGYVYGFEATGTFRIGSEWTLFGMIAFLQGEVDTFPTSDQIAVSETIDRLMPVTAQVGIRWDATDGRFWAELQVVMADRADKLSTRDQGDTQRIPPGGTPGYGVVHLRGGWIICERTHLTVAVENVFDKAYRIHGSGITMPGANLIVSLSFDF